MSPPFTDLAKRLPANVPFVGPEAQERALGTAFVARIGANESVFGPSPKAMDAMKKAAGEVWMYGDPENHDLKEALAERHGVAPENIVIGEGIDGLLGLTVRLFVEPGNAVITSAGAYPTFNFHVTGFDGDLKFVPYTNDREDPSALIDTAQEFHARLIYIANPDNPMGTVNSATALEQMIDDIPSGAILCLDEAYAEFAEENVVPTVDIENPQVIRFRTFSKAQGMAGARIGYALAAKEIALSFNKVRNHFGVNRVAQAGALAALQDGDHLLQVQKSVADARNRLMLIANANGLSAIPSQANFVAIDCGKDGVFAKRVLDELIAVGIFVRMPGIAPLDRCIRVSAGTTADLDAFETALPGALERAAAQD